MPSPQDKFFREFQDKIHQNIPRKLSRSVSNQICIYVWSPVYFQLTFISQIDDIARISIAKGSK